MGFAEVGKLLTKVGGFEGLGNLKQASSQAMSGGSGTANTGTVGKQQTNSMSMEKQLALHQHMVDPAYMPNAKTSPTTNSNPTQMAGSSNSDWQQLIKQFNKDYGATLAKMYENFSTQLDNDTVKQSPATLNADALREHQPIFLPGEGKPATPTTGASTSSEASHRSVSTDVYTPYLNDGEEAQGPSSSDHTNSRGHTDEQVSDLGFDSEAQTTDRGYSGDVNLSDPSGESEKNGRKGDDDDDDDGFVL